MKSFLIPTSGIIRNGNCIADNNCFCFRFNIVDSLVPFFSQNNKRCTFPQKRSYLLFRPIVRFVIPLLKLRAMQMNNIRNTVFFTEFMNCIFPIKAASIRHMNMNYIRLVCSHYFFNIHICPYKISNLLYARSFNISWNKLHLHSDRIPIKRQQLLNNARDSAFYGLMISNHQNLNFLHTIPSFDYKTFREILSIFLYC